MKRMPLRNIAVLVILLAVAIGIIALVFNRAMANYRSNVSIESASHLTELSTQVSRYIGEDIDDKWEEAHVIAAELQAAEVDSLDKLLPLLQSTVEYRGYSDVYLYNDAGHCFDSTGKGMDIDSASEMTYQAEETGYFIKVVKSKVYYTVPIETTLELGGSKVIALSIVDDVHDMLDNLDISSFNGQTSILLVQANGLIISRSANADQTVISVDTLFESGTITNLMGGSPDIHTALNATTSNTFLHTVNGASEYLVTTSVPGDTNNWSIIFCAPEAVVNQTSSEYSTYLSMMSIIMIAAIAMVLAIAMYYLFRERLKSMNEVASRDEMLNLLISNTKSVFTLYSTHKDGLLFESANAVDVLGKHHGARVESTGSGGRLRFTPTDTPDDSFLPELNRELEGWDGTGEFVSDYLPIDVEGEKRFIIVRIYPSHNADEYIAMVQDVTRERGREKALRDALVSADEANRAKSNFLSNMSHDIRTPMNAIVNMTDFALQKTSGYPEVTGYLKTIKTSSDHLLRLINEVLDMSRIESGKTAVENLPFDLLEKIDETSAIIRPICAKKDQEFSCSYSVQHTKLVGDSLKLNQILINILNNAAKFTGRKGSISLSVEETETLRRETAVFRFAISDNGIGIAQEDIDRIFAPFSRVQNDVVSNLEGTGLGLSICRSFVDMMNGKITVKSEVGKGSTFTIELPFTIDETAQTDLIASHGIPSVDKPASSADDSPASDAIDAPLATESDDNPHASDRRDGSADAILPSVDGSFAGLHALLAEDNEINQEIAGMLLERLGFTVTLAGNGKQAVDMVESMPADSFDVIYMDIQMPVMNGYEAAMAIRSSSNPRNASLPIIAMTANVFAEDVEKAREAGMNAHVGKPIMLQEIATATAVALHREEGGLS